jgi:formate dehydrogenase beta subunit
VRAILGHRVTDSCGCSLADVPLVFGTLEQYGCFVGSHAVVVLSDKDDMKAVAVNLMRFFEDESCGQCTPCRAGTEKAVKLMATGPWDKALLRVLPGGCAARSSRARARVMGS